MSQEQSTEVQKCADCRFADAWESTPSIFRRKVVGHSTWGECAYPDVGAGWKRLGQRPAITPVSGAKCRKFAPAVTQGGA